MSEGAAGSEARFQVASDQSLLIYFDQPQEKSRAKAQPLREEKQPVVEVRSKVRPSHQEQERIRASENVRKLLRLLEQEPVAGVRNLHPAYCSLLVKFDALKLRHEELKETFRRYFERLEQVELPKPRIVEIPVCYGGEFGPDLAEVAALHGLTVEQVIDLHTSARYLVYFLGFAPGFAYLGDLPESLVTPRLASPRKKVPPGSVGIAGNQTGVYPFDTPGGWRLLGRTPLEMFRADREHLSLLSIGDRVRFVRISQEELDPLARA